MKDFIGELLANNLAVATVCGSQEQMEQAHVALMKHHCAIALANIERIQRDFANHAAANKQARVDLIHLKDA